MPYIIVITETWLSQCDVSSFSLHGYEHFAVCRPTRGGGISIFISNCVHHSLCTELTGIFDWAELLTLKVQVDDTHFFFSGCYRPPGTSLPLFTSNLETVLFNTYASGNNKFMLIGDFNINLLESTSASNTYVNLISSHDASQLITQPTHVSSTGASPSLLDHVIISNSLIPLFNPSVAVLDDILSDHLPITTNFYVHSSPSNSDEPVTSRIDTDKFCALWENVDLPAHGLTSFTSVSDCYNTIQSLLAHSLDLSSATASSSASRPSVPWLRSPDYRELRRITKTVARSARHAPRNSTLGLILSSYIEKTRSLSFKLKQRYFSHRIQHISNSSSAIWRFLNDQVRHKKKKNCLPISSLQSNGIILTNKKLIANALNVYFSKVGLSLHESLKPTLDACSVSDLSPSINDHSIMIPYPSSSDVENLILKMKTSRSRGFNTFLLKKIRTSISPLIAHLFSLCLSSASFPDDMKHAIITPLFKGGDRTQPINYRPISKIAPIDKLMDRYLFNVLSAFISDKAKDFFHHAQFGFRPRHSTQHAIFNLLHDISSAKSSHLFTLCIFIDLSKAFDTISLPILFNKLSRLGVRGHALDIFKAYLSNRSHSTIVGDVMSPSVPLNCGVPQGSSLGPLLFLIYINDLPFISNQAKFVLFADDTTIYMSGPNVNDLFANMNSVLSALNSYLNKNKLCLNVKKTHYMLFSPTRNFSSPVLPSLIISDQPIDRVLGTKFLGIFIEETLSWKHQISHVTSKISSASGLLFRHRYLLPFNVKILLYRSLILSHLNYSLLFFGHSPESYLHNLKIVLNRAVRAILNAPYHTRLSTLFSQAGLLSLPLLHKFICAKFLHHLIYHNFCELDITQLFSISKSARDPYRLIIHNSSAFSFISHAIPYWNALPIHIRQIKPVRSFLNKLFDYLISIQCDQ